MIDTVEVASDVTVVVSPFLGIVTTVAKPVYEPETGAFLGVAGVDVVLGPKTMIGTHSLRTLEHFLQSKAICVVNWRGFFYMKRVGEGGVHVEHQIYF